MTNAEYVAAARAVGATDFRIIVRHILPNAIGTITVAASVMTASAIVLETTLSYLGLFDRQVYVSLGTVMGNANEEGLYHCGVCFSRG